MNENNESLFQNLVVRLAKIHGCIYHEPEVLQLSDALSFLDEMEDLLDESDAGDHIGIAYRVLISELADEVCAGCIQQLRRKCDRIRDKAQIIAAP